MKIEYISSRVLGILAYQNPHSDLPLRTTEVDVIANGGEILLPCYDYRIMQFRTRWNVPFGLEMALDCFSPEKKISHIFHSLCSEEVSGGTATS